MLVINGIDKLGIHIYVGTNGNVLVGDCEDEKGDFNYHSVDASAYVIDTSMAGKNVMMSKKDYDRLKRRQR